MTASNEYRNRSFSRSESSNNRIFLHNLHNILGMLGAAHQRGPGRTLHSFVSDFTVRSFPGCSDYFSPHRHQLEELV